MTAMIYENKILLIIMCEISEAESSGIVAFIIMHLFFWSLAIIIVAIRYTLVHIMIEVQTFCFGPPFWGKLPIKWGMFHSQMRNVSSSSCFDLKIRGMRTLVIIFTLSLLLVAPGTCRAVGDWGGANPKFTVWKKFQLQHPPTKIFSMDLPHFEIFFRFFE